MSGRGAWLRDRGMGAALLVAGISSAFGGVLVLASDYIARVIGGNEGASASVTLAVVVSLLSWIMIVLAVYVAALVTSNTFATVVAGRTRSIALMRLIGATAASERSRVTRQGFAVGAIGAGAGLVAGWIAWAIAAPLLAARGIDAPGFVPVQLQTLPPAIVVAATTGIAAWAGSRRVLTVTPLQAIGGAVEVSHEQLSRGRGRTIAAALLLAAGTALLALGVMLGLLHPAAIIVSFVGGVCSFTGLAVGSALVMPPVLRAVGALFGRSATARMAAENAMRSPERSSRAAMGVVMGVALVTMFAVALSSIGAMSLRLTGGVAPEGFDEVMTAFTAIMMGIVGVSALIAAIGLVNLLTLGAVQRRRELGLLRTLGLAGTQLRRMLLTEAAHLTIAGTALGLVLGTAYGWVAAQSLFGSAHGVSGLALGIVPPELPLVPFAVIVGAAAVITLVAAVAPARLATRVTPIEALRA